MNIPLCVPHLKGKEQEYLRSCIESNWVSSAGPFVERFEHDLALRLCSPHAVATCSGTAALHIALLVAGVQPDDEVLVPSLSFIAPVNAVRYAGAWPVFMDADPRYWQMDPEGVRRFLETACRRQGETVRNQRTGRRVRAILPVHLLGHPAQMDALLHLALEHHLTVIEDAAEGLGALQTGRLAGTFGDIACLSFNGNKLITAGGGGMILTAREEWARRARHLTTQARVSPEEFRHDEIGYNYRLSNLQAALGCAQLQQLDEHIEAKRCIADRYRKAFEAIPGLVPMPEATWARSTFWMYTILVN
ncbi:MAG: aminotransferase class I/II-fold pyridoxal phosphate-dependent enzyme, partial [Acidobacteriota bacterium]